MARGNTPDTRRFKIRHLFLGLLLILFGWFGFFRITVHRDVSARLRELRDQGYPMSLEELDRSYSLPPGADNAADYYMTAFSQYVEWDSEAQEGLPWVGRGQRLARTESLEPSVRQQAERFLADNEKTLSLLHEAVAIESCRYPTDFRPEFGAGIPWLGEVRKHAFLLCLEGLVACERGDPNQAIASVRAISALAHSLNTPQLIHHLVSNAIQALAYGSAEHVLNRVPLTEGQLQTLSGWLEVSADREGHRQALIGERCFGVDTFRGSPKQLSSQLGSSSKLLTLLMVPRKILGLHDRDMLGYVNLIQDYIEMSDLPASDRLARCDSLEAMVNGPRRLGLLTKILVPALRRVMQLEIRSIAWGRVARTALAVERYRLAEGRLPQALSDLVPTYLGGVPEDPFDGTNLKYRLLDPGFVVYSIGDDLSDDGGAEADEHKRDAEGHSLWDVTFFVER